MIYILLIVFLTYAIHTLRFALRFNNTDTYFTRRQKVTHNILIWLIPFFWIMIIKTIAAPTPGSQHFKKTKDKGGFYESGIGIWGHGESHHSNDDGGDGQV